MTQVSIIAIHGNGGGGFRFQRALEYFSAEVRFSAPTLPGFADRPNDPSLSTLSDYARAIKAMVECEPRPRVLLGHGIGGTVALQLCQNFPDTIDGVILHAPVGALLDRRLMPKIMLLPGMARLGRAVFTNPLLRPYFIDKLFVKPVPEGYLDEFFKEYTRCTVFEKMFHLITHEWFAALKPASVPACILWGKQDRVLSSDHAGEFQKLFPNSTVEIVPDWTHWPMVEKPEDYATVITKISKELAAQ
jgi:pimeloyl-ACP methyl ester carboxylesterase